MKIRKLLTLVGSILLLAAVFVFDSTVKSLDADIGSWFYVRGAFVVLAFVLIAIYIQTGRKGRQPTMIQRIGRIAAWTGLFLGLSVVVSVLRFGDFETRAFRLYPRDYITILCSALLSVAAGIVAAVTILNLREMLLYKRKRGTRRNLWLLFGSFFLASAMTFGLRPLASTVYTTVFFVLSVVLIIVNSFRLSWIAYLSRREKIYAMVYSLLAFFAFMAINVLLSISDRPFLSKALLYYSYPLHTFVQLTSLLGSVYFGMAFISTLFHLPTAEAFDRKQSELSSLHNLSRLITQVFDLNELAETVTNMTFEVCEASGAWLEIFPTEAGRKGVRQTTGIVSKREVSTDEIQTILFGDESSVRSVVISSKKVLLIDDVSNDRRTRYMAKLKKVGSLLVVPLLSHENLIGILYAVKQMDFGFDQDDIDVLSGFADQVTIAIENATLIQRSIEKERLQRELLLAQEMQKRLLPQSLPVFPSVDMQAVSAPALEVGGDYYDVALLDDHHVGIVIGDVSGKGVGAAFYMAEVKGIFQSLSKIYISPKAFLVKANESLLSSIDKRSFISLIYAVLDVASGELVLSRAGHCPMLYATSSNVEYIKPSGMGLGLSSGSLFEDSLEEKKIMMKRGDVCVFYTDGVTESRSASGEEFGYERLVKVVNDNRTRTAEEIREQIIQQVWSYTDAQGYDDDLTVFVVKWNGAARS
ncbi:MAG TPA: GAF domain-containing SpoIIE family protein phosphatase [Bacteroidota bacterium]|nr:GAF domain-containing SpoIIE family protein phosphatase [Bacteroidota bacterium]